MKRYAICAVALLGMAVTLRAAEPADSLAGVPDTVQTAAAEGAEGDAAATAAAAQTAVEVAIQALQPLEMEAVIITLLPEAIYIMEMAALVAMRERHIYMFKTILQLN